MKIAVRILVIVFVACALLVIAFSCKTTRVAEIKSTIETNQKNDIVENEIDKNTCIDSSSRKTITNKKDSVHKSSVVIELSNPDSLGNQYPKRITYSNEDAISNVETANNIHKFSGKTEIKQKSKTDKTDSKSKSQCNNKLVENTVYRPTNWLIIVVAVIILCLIAYYKLKKHESI